MFYADVQHLKPTDFKRLTGVIPATFVAMCDALQKHLPTLGRPLKLSREDQLLMTLMYWREYRTQFHIANTYGSQCYRNRRKRFGLRFNLIAAVCNYELYD